MSVRPSVNGGFVNVRNAAPPKSSSSSINITYCYYLLLLPIATTYNITYAITYAITCLRKAAPPKSSSSSSSSADDAEIGEEGGRLSGKPSPGQISYNVS